ncbi:hypothetical protein A0J61_11860, partial [Choanephora cucurbitarum]
LWKDDLVYRSSLDISKTRNTKKKAYYAMFEVNQKSKQNIIRIIYCTVFQQLYYRVSVDGKPSHFVLGEVLEGNRSPSLLNVPEVKEFGVTGGKYIAFDARDLVCPVSLLQVVKNRNGSEVIFPWRKVIKKGSVFSKDMHKSADLKYR